MTPTTTDRRPRVLFLTPFHFDTAAHDDDFDRLVEQSLEGRGDYDLVARHLAPFERDDATYDADQELAVVEAAREAGADGFDALVVACHYDPAVAPARAISTIPVIAPFALTTSLARQLGPTFAVITDVPEAEPVIAALVESYGHGKACTGVSSIGWDGDAILEDTRGAAQAVDDLVADIAERGDVQSVVIGCTIVSAAYEVHRVSFPRRDVVVLDSNLISAVGAAFLASTS